MSFEIQYQKYIEQKKDLYDIFLQFIESENDSSEYFKKLVDFIRSQQYQENNKEFKVILHLLNSVTNNHHRHSKFQDNIKQFFAFYGDYIKQSFSNTQIYDIFKKNKLVLLILFESKIIIFDEIISNYIYDEDDDIEPIFYHFFDANDQDVEKEAQIYFISKKNLLLSDFSKNKLHFFYPEVYQGKQIENFENFEAYRQIGENESYICQLIRQDLIKEFVIYINKTNFSLSNLIEPSFFDTNPFLSQPHQSKKYKNNVKEFNFTPMKEGISLIEYAAFFGSIQIFRYLLLNHVELIPSLWLYAIHGKNPEINHLLEENEVVPDDESYLECLLESIKCHHNDIANYIKDNLMTNSIEINQNNFQYNPIKCAFHYHNYQFIQDFNNFEFIFYYACLYDYFSIVKFLFDEKIIDFNKKNNFKIIYFF